MDVIDAHCAAEQRAPAEIERTTFAPSNPLDDIDGFLSTMESYAALGIGKVWTGPPNDSSDPVGWVNQVCDKVIPRLRSI